MIDLDLTAHPLAMAGLGIFVLAYVLVALEELLGLRKSKPVIIAATIIWGLIAWLEGQIPAVPHGHAEEAFKHAFLEFAELFAFLLVAMTFINAMAEQRVFEALKAWLLRSGFSYRGVFWITGFLAFFISPIADNLTTALLMVAVVMAVGAGNTRFIVLCCINIVVAANAGGAFSPFGDITTLMVWQRGIVEFTGFFALFLPSLASYVVTAALMSSVLPKGAPEVSGEAVVMARGARRIVGLFLLTIAFATVAHQELDLPAVYGMMGGLGALQIFGFYLRVTEQRRRSAGMVGDVVAFDVFRSIARAEWDTLLFFYGVLMCVAGLAEFGYLASLSDWLYGTGNTAFANVALGVLSAIVDNIPLMLAALTMNPPMDLGQWLLLTFTVGTGGSLLSIGSAAGVGLMGQAHGIYTFGRHLRWSWAIALGYAAGIAVHMWVNAGAFTGIPHNLP